MIKLRFFKINIIEIIIISFSLIFMGISQFQTNNQAPPPQDYDPELKTLYNKNLDDSSLLSENVNPDIYNNKPVGTRTASFNYNSTIVKLEANTITNGLKFQLQQNATVIDASFVMTGLPSFDYRLWDENSVISKHQSDWVSLSPAIGLDGFEVPHVVWMENGNIESSDGVWDIILASKPGENWQPNEFIEVSKGVKPSKYPDIFVDDSDNIHIVWADKANILGCGNDYDIFYRSYDNDGGWSALEIISNQTTDVGSTNPKVVVTDKADIIIVWEDAGEFNGSGNNSDIMCKIWHKETESWSNTYVLSNYTNDKNSTDPDIAFDGEMVFVVWTEEGDVLGSGDDNDIMFRSWDGITWAEPLVISNHSLDSNSGNATVNVCNEFICVAWDDTGNIDSSGDDKDIIMKECKNSKWLESTVISDHINDGESTTPDIDIDTEGNIHIIWVDDGEILPNNNDNDIIYRRWDAQQKIWSENIVISNDIRDRDSIEPKLKVSKSNRVDIVWADDGDIDGSGNDYDIIYKSNEFIYPTNLKLMVGVVNFDEPDWEHLGEFYNDVLINDDWLITKLNDLISQMTQPVKDFYLYFHSDTKGGVEISDFTLRLTGTPLIPTNLHVVDEDQNHVISHKPVFGWEFFDNDSSAQGGFQIQVDSEPGYNDMWDYAWLTRNYEFVEYNGNKLLDNHTYYYRLRVKDIDGAWSEWTPYHNFTMNARPKITKLSPAIGYADEYIDIEWSGTDPNGDALLYTLEASYNSTWHTLVSNEPITQYRFDTRGIDSNQFVDIRMKCFDGFEESLGWFNEEGAIKITHNNPPSVKILSPTLPGSMANDSYIIVWESIDLDINDNHIIDLYYDDDTDFSSKFEIARNLSDTGFYVWDTSNLPNGSYFICIVISDSKDYTYRYSDGKLTIDHTIDSNRLSVISTDPSADATNVPINQVIKVRFNKNIDKSTLTSEFFIVTDTLHRKIEGLMHYNDTKFEIIFYPKYYLDNGQIYTVILKSGIRDLAGNSLENYEFIFSTTPPNIDTLPPYILSVTPEDLSTEVNVIPRITAIFSEEIDRASLTPSPVYVYDESGYYIDTEIIFISEENKLRIDFYGELQFNTKYTILITAQIRDLAGHGFDGNKNGRSQASPIDDYKWSFTTEKKSVEPPDELHDETLETMDLLTIGIILIIVIIILSVLVIRKRLKRQKFVIHDIFVIYHDGRLLAHQSFESISNVEEGAMGGMLTAIQNFVVESFRDQDTDKLEEIKYGNLKIILVHGKNIYLAAVYSGEININNLKRDMNNILSVIELKFDKVLDKWDGSMKKVREIGEFIRF